MSFFSKYDTAAADWDLTTVHNIIYILTYFACFELFLWRKK